jgi:23S rRNA (adenine1618-N6)-methyltransferase
MDELVKTYPELEQYIFEKNDGGKTIDFSEPKAVKALNTALLAHYYNIAVWDIPEGYLCPAIPGRADYIHHIADLLTLSNDNVIPTGNKIVGLDIGVGANAAYPIIGSQCYGWRFVGSDIDPISVKSATLIVDANHKLKNLLTVRKQTQPGDIFDGIIKPQDNFAFTLCNPPFHSSAAEAQQGSERKVKNLTRHSKKRNPSAAAEQAKQGLNFAGQHRELWCEGGELVFICNMIRQSQKYAQQVNWFTSLVSKKNSLKGIYNQLERVGATEVKTVNMAQGQKVSRFVAWRF